MGLMALLASSKGRVGRSAFWAGWLVLVGIVGLCNTIGLGFGWLLSAPTVYGFVCVSAKRLHDMGVSGWLAPIPIVASIAALVGVLGGGIEFLSQGKAGAFVATSLVSGILVVAFLLWLGVTRGEPDDNRHGPPPAAPRFN